MARGLAYQREQRDRITRNRRQAARWRTWDPTGEYVDGFQSGRFFREQIALGCHRANCGICGGYHSDERTRLEREALRHEDRAS